MSVTIYEVAARAGVSSSTVARVLRGETKGSQRRSEKTIERILAIAKEMGYRTNLRARAFSKGRTHGVALVYTDDAWVFEGVNPIVVNALTNAFQAEGFHLTLTPVDDSGSWEEVITGGQVDGCVVFQRLPDDVQQVVKAHELPTVLLGDDSEPTVSHVSIDDVAGAYAATKHLIGLGHRRIVYYTHQSIKPHCSIEARERGYLQAMEESGLSEGRHLHADEGTISNLLLSQNRPTAVLCYSNLESTQLMHMLWQFGIRVPQDVSLVGFNDLFATAYMTPPLTTVGFDAPRIGVLGAEILLEAIARAVDGEAAVVRKEILQPRLVVRSSTGPVTN